jgi:hypothetical protein
MPQLASHKDELAEQIIKDTPVPVDGLSNVWCVSALLENEIALVHMIGTNVDGLQ